MIDKKELYELLRADGAKLKAINFYTVEQLRDAYFDRFGVEYIVTGNNEDADENSNTDIDDTGNNEDADVEIRTLVFDRGGWCNELKNSYAMGIYRPATAEEYAVLKKYASKVL